MPEPSCLIYGANGYTGELIAREAVRRGLRPILAGRRRQPIQALARELDLASRVFELDDPGRLDEGLRGVQAVLHCAGPFVRTAPPMVEACLRSRAHYLDITGEIPAVEYSLGRSSRALESGIVLLPCVGVDVVPSDCLAARLAEALPDATDLHLAFSSARGALSRGTIRSMIEAAPRFGLIRQHGELVSVPFAHDLREIQFSSGRGWAITLAWGDLVTAFVTTGIPNIRVYAGVPKKLAARARRLRGLIPILGMKPIKRALQWWVGRLLSGPDEATRSRARVQLWGEVRNATGDVRTATLETPEGYTFTATAAVECLQRVLEGNTVPGFQTPARAFGNRFVDSLPGVVSGPVSESSVDSRATKIPQSPEPPSS